MKLKIQFCHRLMLANGHCWLPLWHKIAAGARTFAASTGQPDDCPGNNLANGAGLRRGSLPPAYPCTGNEANN
jgi:hypothetical protein